MRCRAWPIVMAMGGALIGCLEDQQALQSSDPIYTMVFFAPDSMSLNNRAEDHLAETVRNPTPPIKAALQPGSKARICVTGHTDNVGPETINSEVGQRRADAVGRYLVGLGVPERRIVTASLGSSRPLVTTGPGTPEISNRRV